MDEMYEYNKLINTAIDHFKAKITEKYGDIHIHMTMDFNICKVFKTSKKNPDNIADFILLEAKTIEDIFDTYDKYRIELNRDTKIDDILE